MFFLAHEDVSSSTLLDLAATFWHLRLFIGDTTFDDAVAKTFHVPLAVLAYKVCPSNLEATIFSTLISLSSIGHWVFNSVSLLEFFLGCSTSRIDFIIGCTSKKTISNCDRPIWAVPFHAQGLDCGKYLGVTLCELWGIVDGNFEHLPHGIVSKAWDVLVSPDRLLFLLFCVFVLVFMYYVNVFCYFLLCVPVLNVKVCWCHLLVVGSLFMFKA